MSAATGDAALGMFVRHEMRLAWRDWRWMFEKRGSAARSWKAIIGIVLVVAIVHLIAYAVLSPFFASGAVMDQQALATICMSLVLSFAMILSQAIESVTRAFYARDDMDLILSSPAPSSDLFSVRIAMMALSSFVMATLISAPLINISVWLGGPKWLAGYAVMSCVALLATGLAVLLTLAMFRTFGAYRTRVYAQVGAAIVGALFVIGLQVFGILALGSISRMAVLRPEILAAYAPDATAQIWLPARAFVGETGSLIILLLASIAVFVIGVKIGAVQFRSIVISAAAATQATAKSRRILRSFQRSTIRKTLIHKEIRLLGRDPWLISQSLMQVLYLIPPAMMLWLSFGEMFEIAAVIAPVVVMAVGQLAGGLAWLTLCGEEAPDLIQSAPLKRSTRLWAKAWAVILIACAVVSPFVLGLLFISSYGALITLLSALAATACVIIIQFWFGAQADRSLFRKRQIASKAATFIEAGASISCAVLAASLVSASVSAVIPGIFLALIMGIGWSIRPRGEGL